MAALNGFNLCIMGNCMSDLPSIWTATRDMLRKHAITQESSIKKRYEMAGLQEIQPIDKQNQQQWNKITVETTLISNLLMP